MPRICCTAQFVALRLVGVVVLPLALTACGTVELFGQYDLPESAEVSDAPWPRLVDVPVAPARGTFTDAVPDPEEGARTQADLSAAAVAAEVKAKALSGPVIDPAERAALLAAVGRK